MNRIEKLETENERMEEIHDKAVAIDLIKYNRNIGKIEILKEVEAVINKVFPKCTCKSTEKVDHTCKKEWIETWSEELNKILKQRLELGE